MESLPLIATAVGLFVSTSATLLGGVKWMLGRVEQRTDQRFDRMDARFDRMDARLTHLEASTDERFTAVNAALSEVKIGIARLEGPRPPFLIARG